MSDKRNVAETPLLNRRSTMALGAFSAAAVLGNLGGAARAQGSGGVKLTVLYAPQKDPDAFTKYYLSKHMPMVDKVSGVKKTEVATVLPPAPNQPAPAYYRITEIYFENVETMLNTLASPEWNAVRADTANFMDPGTLTAFASQIGA
jgi:uncharacterized protein (TIGR02118 family)